MSVHNEALEINKPVDADAPALEFQAITQDSLSMFLAAIGGAILGMLLTLLVLAIINGGTLSFTGGERLGVFEQKLSRVDENLGTVSGNLDVIAKQAQGIQSQITAVEENLRTELQKQDGDISTMRDAVSSLGETKTQFDSFMTALSEVLSTMPAPAEGTGN